MVVVVDRLEVRSLGGSFGVATGQAEGRAWAVVGVVDAEEGHDVVDHVDRVGCSAIVDHHNHLQQEDLADLAEDQGLEDLCMEQTADH